MLLEKDLRKIFKQLVSDDVAHVQLGDSDITIQVHDNSSKLSLLASVFEGGNFIPKSVRDCTLGKAPFISEHIKAGLVFDEDHFRIFLRYLGRVESLNHESFKALLEEFGWLADEWRIFLEDHGKQDLVHVRVK